MKRLLFVLAVCCVAITPVSANIVDDIYSMIFGSEDAPVYEDPNISFYEVQPSLIENLSITENSITLDLNSDNQSQTITSQNDNELITGTTENVVIVRSR